jgi:hypothetical protein
MIKIQLKDNKHVEKYEVREWKIEKTEKRNIKCHEKRNNLTKKN